MDRRCSRADCAAPSAVTLANHEYCVAHFIATCYQHIEKLPQEQPLQEIIDRATAVGLTTPDLTNQQRGQLLDIVLWAGELLGRTGPRVPQTHP